jgi:hypothetical protein
MTGRRRGTGPGCCCGPARAAVVDGEKGRSGGVDWVGWGPCGVGWVSGHMGERERLPAMTLTDALNEYGRQHESRTTSIKRFSMHA